MSTGTSNRSCGGCGAPVDASAMTCPRCGALLAAYEAPRGSEGGTADTTLIIPSAPLLPAPHTQAPIQPPRRPDPPGIRSPEVPGAPIPTPQAAIREPDPTLTVASPHPAPARPSEPPQVPRPARHPRPGSVPATPPPRDAPSRQHPAPARQPSTREIASLAATFGKLALGVLMILVFLGILDFNVIPILVLGVVMLSLLGIMRSAAKASGRKTTTMHDPKRRDSRRR